MTRLRLFVDTTDVAIETSPAFSPQSLSAIVSDESDQDLMRVVLSSHFMSREPRHFGFMMPLLNHILLLMLALLTSTAPLGAQDKKPDTPADPFAKWEKSIQAFEQEDAKSPPPKNKIVFVGSSSVRMWKTEPSFPGFQVINRGFGGSQIADSVHFIDRLVLKHEPRDVVFYAGDNDIASGKNADRVFSDFKAFADKLHAGLPQARLHFIAIKPSVSRWKMAETQRVANQAIAKYAQSTDWVSFVDIWDAMLDGEGQPRSSLFLKDGLHMSEDGYRIWNAAVLSHLLGANEKAEVSPRELSPAGEHIYRVKSSFQASETKIRVLVPEDLPTNARPRVVYLLPVEAQDERKYGDGLEEARRLNLANRYGVICVAPTFSHLPWYADHPTDRAIRQESYMLKVVVPAIEARYPTSGKAEDRLLLGFSKSGWGAFSLLLRHPKQFGRAAAWDAPLMMKASGNYGSGSIFGTDENFKRYQLTELVQQQAAVWGTTPRLIHLSYGNFRAEHVEFEATLNQWKISHVYQDGPSRKHVWESGWVEDAARLLLNVDK